MVFLGEGVEERGGALGVADVDYRHICIIMLLHKVKVYWGIVEAQICPRVVKEVLGIITWMHLFMALAVPRTPIVAQIDGETGLNEERRQGFILGVEPRLTIH